MNSNIKRQSTNALQLCAESGSDRMVKEMKESVVDNRQFSRGISSDSSIFTRKCHDVDKKVAKT